MAKAITEKKKEVYVSGIASGKWKVTDKKGKTIQTIEVNPSENTASFTLSKGQYNIVLSK
jgi:hypothetical protein